MSELIANRWQARKVRWVAWGSALWCIGFLYWAADMSQTYGLSPGDGGVLRPPAARWTVAAILALIGILPFLGMVIYTRLYVIGLAREGDELRVTVIGLLAASTRIHAVRDVNAAREHHGQFRGRITVNAPWTVLRIAGRPYIIDRQAERIDGAAIRRLVNDGEKARRSNT